MEAETEERTKKVHKRAAKKTLHGFEQAGPMAAAELRTRTAKQLATSSGATPPRLELSGAAERHAHHSDQGAPLGPASGLEGEAGSCA